ncbi:flavin reductase family protein [Sphingobacterium shayense]|uniref:flavin reductase family protein n=1 Tax=Sphingobacterium shayense TaxID=626343 RepID=UPI001556ADDF|nr:flavin reductase family protein [Sphingobacterium shayense]NQD70643.1 flavin reductase family protein [Sphingobacterium shayense]
MHRLSEPSILYFGTPVVLITSTNTDDTYNIAPISSIFWLGWRAIIGISTSSKTTENILRTRECVLNLPSINQIDAVNRLALTTGSNPVPSGKLQKGYIHVKNKFSISQLTPMISETVLPPRIKECPVQMEALMESYHGIAKDDEVQVGKIITIELRIKRVYIDELLLLEGCPNKVNPNKWSPVIMSFQQFYGLSNQLSNSKLSTIPEELYRRPDKNR